MVEPDLLGSKDLRRVEAPPAPSPWGGSSNMNSSNINSIWTSGLATRAYGVPMASSWPPDDDLMDRPRRRPPLGAGEGVKDIICSRNLNFPPFLTFLMQYCIIIHKNDPPTKPDLMVVFPNLQLHPDQCQSCPSLGAGSHHPQPKASHIWTY